MRSDADEQQLDVQMQIGTEPTLELDVQIWINRIGTEPTLELDIPIRIGTEPILELDIQIRIGTEPTVELDVQIWIGRHYDSHSHRAVILHHPNPN